MAVRDDTDYFISSAYLNWIYAICQQEPSLRSLADRILPLSSPDITGHSISWSGLTDLLFNIELLLGPAELEKAGRDSWRSTPLRELAQAASLVYRPLDQLLAMYGHTGYVSQVYPLQGKVEQTDEHHAQITLKMQPDAVPCHAFFAFITGQIRQLTVAMAWPAADVAVLRTGTSIRYTIALPQQNKKPLQNQGEQQTLASRSIATSLLRQHQDLLHQQHLLTELSLKSERQTAKPQSTSWQDVQMLAARLADAVLIVDHQQLICFANPAAESLLGQMAETLKGQSVHRWLANQSGTQLSADLLMTSTPMALTVRRNHGEPLPVLASFSGLSTNDHNMTFVLLRDNKLASDQADRLALLERSLRAAQRTDSLARLTGGVAHDFSNLLIATLGYVELAEAAPSKAEVDQALTEIHRAAVRGQHMTRRLLDFSREQEAEPRSIAINHLLSELRDFLFRLMPPNIDCKLDLDSAESYIFGDTTQLEQAIMNLAINARDAMPAGGQLNISTRVQPEEALLQIAISDTGTGMDARMLRQIFEPFYTTKPAGKGTGLGLSVVKDILEAHDGQLGVESSIGSGTTFTITLPTSRAPTRATGRPAEPRSQGGSEHILLLEEDAQVRELARLILLASGYQVDAFADGVSGLHRFSAQPQDYDLVLMSALLPGLDAPVIAEKMLALNPDIRLAHLSSGANGNPQQSGLAALRIPCITKPFDRHGLRTAVRTLLDGPHSLDAPDLFG